MNKNMEQKKCFLYKAIPTNTDAPSSGWIGGCPPACFDKEDTSVKGNLFYMTFILPNEQRQISIFLPEDSDMYLYKNRYPNCAIKVIEHHISSEGTKIELQHPAIMKHDIILYKECCDVEAKNEPFLLKLGGTPRLVQNKRFYYDQLEKEGYFFYMQIDEDGYPLDGLLKGNSPFCYGALYLYAKRDNNITKNIIAGYWQST